MLLNLKGKRVAKGYTQKELAKVLGISVTSYNLKETGKKDFKYSEIQKLIVILNTTYEELFEKKE